MTYIIVLASSNVFGLLSAESFYNLLHKNDTKTVHKLTSNSITQELAVFQFRFHQKKVLFAYHHSALQFSHDVGKFYQLLSRVHLREVYASPNQLILRVVHIAV